MAKKQDTDKDCCFQSAEDLKQDPVTLEKDPGAPKSDPEVTLDYRPGHMFQTKYDPQK